MNTVIFLFAIWTTVIAGIGFCLCIRDLRKLHTRLARREDISDYHNWRLVQLWK